MRINTKQYPIKYIVIAIVILCLILATATWWFISHSNNDTTSDITDSSLDVEPAPSELSEEDAAAKQKFIEEQQDTSDSTNSDDATDSSDAPDTTDNIKLTAKQDGTNVTISSQITTIGDGSCALSIKNGSKTYTASADVIYQPSYSTCAGFSVPVSELEDGTWTITVSVTSANNVKASATTSLEVT